jgi:SAM-dependent methyltransferase
MTSEITPYLDGTKLYGDNFDPEEIGAWYDDEREGYAGLGEAREESAETYGYNAFNWYTTLKHLPAGNLGDAMGLGASFGGEFLPILDRLRSITILEPSMQLRSNDLRGVPLRYADPAPSGVMPFDDDSFDLVTCFGVLHHIPNVSFVVGEMARVIRPGGYALVREPIHSMGDWREPRAGLTKRERGIPQGILTSLMTKNFEVRRAALCDFPSRGALANRDSAAAVKIDRLLSAATRWNYSYHATNRFKKIRPRGMAFVLQKT